MDTRVHIIVFPSTVSSVEPRDDRPSLSDRERNILRLVVEQFVDTAGPVGSRSLAKDANVDLSAASIRNTMADLEDMGYLDHPYTSAGRVPTQLGYRTFVDELMDTPELSEVEREVLKVKLARLVSDTDELLSESTRLLSKLTNLLGIALSPRLSTAVLDRLDIVPLSGSRLMFVLSVRGGLVKTVVLSFESDLPRSKIDRIVSILNERIAGLTLREIRDTYEERLKDLPDDTGLVQLVLDEASLLFSEPDEGRLQFDGTQNIISQPEFQEPDDVRQLIETIEDEDRIVQVLENLFEANPEAVGQAVVRIGSETDEAEMDDYSIVLSPYQLGDTVGSLGVIGPKRMDYGRAVALVEKMASVVNRPADDEAADPSVPS
ncbi:MAG: heat-inducible transcription repressor HrcA [Bacteroidetes bacterium SW_8_64_56]|nr:MAG: heat-inducible transcription repressor HrcA [Bacteroidetes bacterium QS_4_64_154]PSQ99207.1 MAG: heat-inducible transcription repressor HrcA [Bacteroidetes bacterium SW_7_64_58]PSR02357.1 MAG: heat-inducible transcription repressor HrcA [Bacteroidetes bacterium SW_8_64_56]